MKPSRIFVFVGLALAVGLSGCARLDEVSSFENRCRSYADVSEAGTSAYPCSCPKMTRQGLVYETPSKWLVSYCKNWSLNDFYSCLCGDELPTPSNLQ